MCSLDLDAWINEPPSESESEDDQPKAIFAKEETKHSRTRHTEVDEKELAKVSWAEHATQIVYLYSGASPRRNEHQGLIFTPLLFNIMELKVPLRPDLD